MPAEDRSRMSLQEFIESGCLQEINRLLLHPRGLAISCKFDADTDLNELTEWRVEVLDSRDDPEGFVFVVGDPGDPAEEFWWKEANFCQLLTSEKKEHRGKLFSGEVVQPAGYEPPGLRKKEKGATSVD